MGVGEPSVLWGSKCRPIRMEAGVRRGGWERLEAEPPGSRSAGRTRGLHFAGQSETFVALRTFSGMGRSGWEVDPGAQASKVQTGAGAADEGGTGDGPGMSALAGAACAVAQGEASPARSGGFPVPLPGRAVSPPESTCGSCDPRARNGTACGERTLGTAIGPPGVPASVEGGHAGTCTRR